MAFWDSWFRPKCESCGEKIMGEIFDIPVKAKTPMDKDSTAHVCESCQKKWAEQRAREEAELEERLRAEEEMRKRVEDGTYFSGARRNT